MRSYCGSIGIFIGTALLGVGIAVGNVLLPSFIKAKFPHKIPEIMSIYTIMLKISTIIGIFLPLWLLEMMSIPNVMAFWLIFSIIAFVAYIPQCKNDRILRQKSHNRNSLSMFRESSAWKIAFFMGLQSFIAYSVFAWLPSIITHKGYDTLCRKFVINTTICYAAYVVRTAFDG